MKFARESRFRTEFHCTKLQEDQTGWGVGAWGCIWAESETASFFGWADMYRLFFRIFFQLCNRTGYDFSNFKKLLSRNFVNKIGQILSIMKKKTLGPGLKRIFSLGVGL
jgi:hypothetical protein